MRSCSLCGHAAGEHQRLGAAADAAVERLDDDVAVARRWQRLLADLAAPGADGPPCARVHVAGVSCGVFQPPTSVDERVGLGRAPGAGLVLDSGGAGAVDDRDRRWPTPPRRRPGARTASRRRPSRRRAAARTASICVAAAALHERELDGLARPSSRRASCARAERDGDVGAEAEAHVVAHRRRRLVEHDLRRVLELDGHLGAPSWRATCRRARRTARPPSATSRRAGGARRRSPRASPWRRRARRGSPGTGRSTMSSASMRRTLRSTFACSSRIASW